MLLYVINLEYIQLERMFDLKLTKLFMLNVYIENRAWAGLKERNADCE